MRCPGFPLLPFIAGLVLLAGPVPAEEPPEKPAEVRADGAGGFPPRNVRKWELSFGGFWAHYDTNARVDSTILGRRGVRFDAEDDLDLDEASFLWHARAAYRIADRHHLEFSYYRLHRDATKVLSTEIAFGDEIFEIGTEVDSFFNIDIYRLAYGYSFVSSDRWELGLTLGLHVADIAMGIRSLDGLVEGFTGVTAPLPDIGFHALLAITPRLLILSRNTFFYLDIAEYRGSIVNLAASLQYRIFEQFSLEGGYQLYRIGMEADYGWLNGEIEFLYHGPFIAATLFF